MKYRLMTLKKVNKQIKHSDNPNSRFYKPQKDLANLVIGVGSIVIAILYGTWGIIISHDNDRMQQEMKSIAVDEFNIAAFQFNMENQKKLATQMEAYNNIIFQFSDMENILIYHKLQKARKIRMRNGDVSERVKALEIVLMHLQKMGNLDDLFPQKGIGQMYGDCMSDIVALRYSCLEYMALAGKIDTSKQGQEVYTKTMESVLTLEDTVLHSVLPARDTLFPKIGAGAKLLDEFGEMFNKRYEAMKKEAKERKR